MGLRAQGLRFEGLVFRVQALAFRARAWWALGFRLF